MLTNSNHYIHPAKQVIFLLLSVVGFAIIGSVIAMGLVVSLYGMDVMQEISHPSAALSGNVLNALRIVQTITSLSMFLGASVFFAYRVVYEPEEYLKATNRFPAVLLLLALAIMLCSRPILEFLTVVNLKMTLPDSLRGLENWMRESEKSNQLLIEALLDMKTFADLLISLLIIGLFTAIAEEFIFRGCLQTILIRWIRNPHTGIWVTAAIFSAIHVQFFGFLPRLMLGVLFGYFAYWSGSIWPAVWGHFLHNGSSVVLVYLFQHHKIADPDAPQTFNYIIYLLSLILTCLLMYTYRNVSRQQPLIG